MRDNGSIVVATEVSKKPNLKFLFNSKIWWYQDFKLTFRVNSTLLTYKHLLYVLELTWLHILEN